MSLSQSVTKAINDIVHSFIQQLADKYNLDPNELLSEWEGNSSSKRLTPKKSLITDIPKQTDEINTDDLLNYKKPELQALCRQRGIKCSGTKAQLIGFLLGKDIPLEKKENNNSKKVVSKVSSTPVATKLTSNIKPAAIRMNQYGNYEHAETSLIFDKKTKNVIGKQCDGEIKELTVEDIDICKQMKFDYVIPNNLDNNKNKDDYVEELDDDEIVEEEEEVEEEEVVVEEEEEVLLDEEDFIEDEEDFIEEEDEEYE